MRENSDDFDQNINKFEDIWLVYFLVDFVLADIKGNIEEGDKFEL